MAVEFHALAVTVQNETEDSVSLSFDVPEELRDRFSHVAGQHVVMRAVIGGEDVRRSYSICSSPGSGRLRVGIKRVPGGVFSTYATTQLKDGDTVELMAPIGEFVHECSPATPGRYVALAAGSGITPILSIVTAILEQEPASQVTLVYGNRSTGSIMFLEDLEALKNRYTERLRVVHVLSREPHQVPLFQGRIDADKLRLLSETLIDVAAIDRWFLCGPLEMVEQAQATLADLGVAQDRIAYELFFDQRIESLPEADDDDEATVSMTVTLDGRSSVVAVDPQGPSLLDYARSVRAEVPFACKGGMCATCTALVVEGQVRMDKNYALTRTELDQGMVLTCQAHPVDGDIAISYDVHGGLGR